MQSKRSGKSALVLGLVAILLLSLPLMASAQTTTTGSASAAVTATSGVGVTTNGLAAPREGQNISGQFVVRGYANDPNFMKWQLDLLPFGDATQASFLALGETAGVFTYTLDTTSLPVGQHALRLRVVRNDSNYAEYTTNFTVGKAAATTTGGTASSAAATSSTTAAKPATAKRITAASALGVTENGLAGPREGQAISGQFIVRGFANDPNFMKWQLDLLPNGDPNSAGFLAFGETSGVFTYTLDTTNLPAGQHALRLRVVRNDSNYTEYTTNFTIGKAAATTGGAGSSTAGGTSTASGAATGTTGSTTGTTGAGITTNGLAAPTAGQTLSGQFVVKGYANDPNFMKWQLDLLPFGDATMAGTLAVGETTGVFTYTLDTTGLPAGEHSLRLRVVRNDSNYSEYAVPFKIGK